MGNTIYGSFTDANLAEKAVGALLDFGVQPEDISVVRSITDFENANTAYQGTSPVPVDEQAWTGENRNTEANRIGYSGAAYDSTSTPPDVTPSGREENYETTHEYYAAQNANVGVSSYRATAVPVTSEDSDGPIPTNSEYDLERAAKTGISTTTAADAGAGAIKGAGWGAAFGVLGAIAALTVPGFGLVLGGGALAAAIGAAVGATGAGAIAGGVTGYLKDQGMDEHVAASYEKALREGGAMVAVTAPSGNIQEFQIVELIEKYGGLQSNQKVRSYLA
jgi:hypothetical protein